MEDFDYCNSGAKPNHIWEMILCIIFAVVAVCVTALVLIEPAQAQTVPAWEKLNESCQGAPLIKSGKDNPDCKARNKVAKQLVLAGWLQAPHGVWVSPEQQNFAGQVIAKYDGQLGANLGEFASLAPALLTELRTQLADTQIFAVWNSRQTDIRANAPYGAAMLDEIMARLAMHYARSGDPRLALGQ